MSNVNSPVVHHSVSVSIPEIATRAEWTTIAKKLRAVSMTNGLAADSDKNSAFLAIASASYALLISSSLDGDDSILVSTERLFAGIPDATDKKGCFKGRYDLKVKALRAAFHASVDNRKAFAQMADIPASKMLESIVLHGEISALLPKTVLPKSVAKKPAVAVAVVVPAVPAVAGLSDVEILQVERLTNVADKVSQDSLLESTKAHAESVALAEIAAIAEKAKIEAANAAKALADRENEISRLTAEKESMDRKAVAFCKLADALGIKLTKQQLAVLSLLEKVAA